MARTVGLTFPKKDNGAKTPKPKETKQDNGAKTPQK